jgi:hypothetical protein
MVVHPDGGLLEGLDRVRSEEHRPIAGLHVRRVRFKHGDDLHLAKALAIVVSVSSNGSSTAAGTSADA